MFFYEGFTCPVCGKPFEDGEDIVACPVCGAPHHRECWQQEGHCHFEADHGTERQWSREKSTAQTADAPQEQSTRPCPHCGHENPAFAEYCAHCGRPTEAQEWQSSQTPPNPRYSEYSPFFAAVDPYGGVAPDEDIEGVPANELAAYVNTNILYYLPRFKRLSGGQRTSWNWAAFLLTPYWLLYRKQYFSGLLVLVFEVVRSMVAGFIAYGIMHLEQANMDTAVRTLLTSGNASLVTGMLTFVVVFDLLLRLFFGLMGNGLYLRHAVSRIGKIKDDNPTVALPDLAVAGGVSFSMGIVAYAVIWIAEMIAQLAFLS